MDLVSDSTSKILGRLDPRDFLNIYPHSSAPCHNLHPTASVDKLHSIESFYQLCHAFSYHASYPLPMFKPSIINRQIVNGLDPGLTLLKEKLVWEKYKAHLMKYCSQAQAEECEVEMKLKKKPRVPFNFALLADHISKDPDRYLNANYNVYYTGGSMSWFEKNCKKYLLRPKGDNTGQILLDQLSTDTTEAADDGDISLMLDTGKEGPIYQIDSSNSFMVARSRNEVNLFSVSEEEDNLTLKKNYKINRPIPFYSVALSSKTFCTVSANREMEVHDTGEEKLLQKGLVGKEEGVHMSDNWCSAHYIDTNIVCFIDRASVSFIDLRVKTDVLRRWPVGDKVEHCEEIYCGAGGGEGGREREYVVTTHQALSLDHRAGFVQRWTHGITHSPSFISVLYSNLSDKILIGSQRSGALVLIENNCINDEPASFCHPYSLPTLVETLHMARYNGYCLGNTLSSRFFMSTTGLCFLESENGLTVMKQSSAGDVFTQRLTKDASGLDSSLTDENFGYLEEWEQACEDTFIEKTNYCPVQEILSDKHLLNCLENGNDNYDESGQKVDSSTSDSWKISKKELQSYCDYLAPRILKEWGLEELEEWSEGLSEERTFAEVSSDENEDITETVAHWIETYCDDSNEIDYSYERTPSRNSRNAQSEMVEDSLKIDESQADVTLPSSTPLPKPKVAFASLPKKHISGF